MKSNMKNNKGLTLIELIIAMAITSIVILGMFSLLQFGYRVYTKGTDQFTAQSDGRLAIDQVIQEIKYASEITILTDSVAEGEMASTDYDYLIIKDATLYQSTIDSSTGLRTGNKIVSNSIDGVSSEFSKISGIDDTVLVHFEFAEKNEEYELESKVKLINIGLQSTSAVVQGLDSGTAIKYKIPLRSDVLTSIPTTVPPIPVTLMAVRGTDENTGVTTDEITAPEGVLLMKAIISPSNATDTTVSWQVITTNIATIDSSTGLLTARGDGSVVVYAFANDGSGVTGNTTITVSGQALPLGISNSTSISVPKGTTYTYKPIGVGGATPYEFEYIIQTGSDGTYSIAADNSELVWNAPNGLGKSIFFKVVIKDSFDITRSYDITLTSINP